MSQHITEGPGRHSYDPDQCWCSPESRDTPVAPTTPLWDELIMHALASDGPIRDSDVKEAVRYYRPKIEAAIAAQAVQYGFREGASQVARDRDDKAEPRSTPAEALDVCPDCGLTAERIGQIHITAQRARLRCRCPTP